MYIKTQDVNSSNCSYQMFMSFNTYYIKDFIKKALYKEPVAFINSQCLFKLIISRNTGTCF